MKDRKELTKEKKWTRYKGEKVELISLHTYLPQPLHHQLKWRAYQHSVSVSTIVRFLVNKHFEEIAAKELERMKKEEAEENERESEDRDDEDEDNENFKGGFRKRW